MAIKIDTTYPPGRYVAPSAEYTTGAIKDSSLPTLKDGSPLLAALPNDMQGFTDALLASADLAHSGTPDTALNSQRLDALSRLFVGYTPVSGGGALEANKRYLIMDDATYSLPDTTGLTNRSTVEIVRFGTATDTTTAFIDVDGTNGEMTEYYNPTTGILEQTDVRVIYNVMSRLIFLFNETSGNWEL